jgi:hypothetical protein
MRRITTLVAALVAAVIAVTPAYAGTIDRVDRYDSPTSSLAGTVSHQDLRGEHAQDAARLAAVKQDLRGEHARDAARHITHAPPKPPVYWSYAYQAPTPKPAPIAATDPDDGTPWGVIGGIAAACLLIGGLAAKGTRRRVRAHA